MSKTVRLKLTHQSLFIKSLITCSPVECVWLSPLWKRTVLGGVFFIYTLQNFPTSYIWVSDLSCTFGAGFFHIVSTSCALFRNFCCFNLVHFLGTKGGIFIWWTYSRFYLFDAPSCIPKFLRSKQTILPHRCWFVQCKTYFHFRLMQGLFNSWYKIVTMKNSFQKKT